MEYFITRDGPLLAQADVLYKEFRLFLLRPSDFIRQIDEIERGADYAPAKLGGTVLKFRLVKAIDEERIAQALHTGQNGESRGEFLGRLRGMLADPMRFEVRVVTTPDDAPLAVISYDSKSSSNLRVPLLRTGNGGISATLARHLLYRASTKATNIGAERTTIEDPFPSSHILVALKQDNWLPSANNNWSKWSIRFLGPHEDLIAKMRELLATEPEHASTIFSEIQRLTNVAEGPERALGAQTIERLIWPAKIIGAGIQNFIVPIKATWARHLFDEVLAHQDLFGARTDLALNRESVYYRAARPEVLTTPGHILWYVSQNKKLNGTMSIRAHSSLDEVAIGPAREVFSRFRRFGVYEWRDIKKITAKSKNDQIMAFRFSNTQSLPTPIPLSQISSTFEKFGKRLNLISPFRVDDDIFSELLRIGDLA